MLRLYVGSAKPGQEAKAAAINQFADSTRKNSSECQLVKTARTCLAVHPSSGRIYELYAADHRRWDDRFAMLFGLLTGLMPQVLEGWHETLPSQQDFTDDVLVITSRLSKQGFMPQNTSIHLTSSYSEHLVESINSKQIRRCNIELEAHNKPTRIVKQNIYLGKLEYL